MALERPVTTQLYTRKQPFLPKVKTGCAICKLRKIKCDETKPHCNRCNIAGRACPGYPELDSRGRLVARPGNSTTWLGSDAEKRSFDFFLTHASKHLAGYFNASFWSREILQATIDHPPIRHLVVAIGAVYEHFERRDIQRLAGDAAGVREALGLPDGNRGATGMRFALQQCNQSIVHIAKLAGATHHSLKDLCCILTASVLLAVFASLQGHFLQAIAHIRSGIRVLHNWESHRGCTKEATNGNFPVPLSRLRSLLTSLYTQARAMINDEARANIQLEGDKLNDPLASSIAPIPARFLHLQDAQRCVETLLANALSFFQRTELRPPTTLTEVGGTAAERDRLIVNLKSSMKALHAYETTPRIQSLGTGAETNDTTEQAAKVLRLYHLWLSVRLSVASGPDAQRESAFDDLEGRMENMLELCREILVEDIEKMGSNTYTRPVYSSGLGVVMPLQMVAARCRNMTIRQGALDLLRRAQRREWVWDSNLVNSVVSGTVDFEQRAMSTNNRGIQDAGQAKQRVPHDMRVREVKVIFEGDRGARLVYTTVEQWRDKKSGYQRTIKW